MRLVNYLDELNWTQTRLWKESGVSASTLRRIRLGHPIQREKADAICRTLSKELGRPIRVNDIDEIQVIGTERPERRKNHKEPPPD